VRQEKGRVGPGDRVDNPKVKRNAETHTGFSVVSGRKTPKKEEGKRKRTASKGKYKPKEMCERGCICYSAVKQEIRGKEKKIENGWIRCGAKGLRRRETCP